VEAPSLFFPLVPMREWDDMAVTLAGGTDPSLFAYRLRYRYDGYVYDAVVGEPRSRREVLEDRRGLRGRLSRGDPLGRREASGNVVLALVRGDPLRVYELAGDLPSPWPNPFLVASTEIVEIVGFGGS